MSEPQHRPVFTIRYGSDLSVEYFANQNEMLASEVMAELKGMIREHYNNFRTKPFNLVYSPSSGYIVEATSVVGVIAGRILDVVLQPKLPNLSLGKCLGLAQHSNNQGAAFINKKPVGALFSDQTDYSSLEYIALTFYDAVITVIKNGVARRFREVMILNRKIEGALNIQETIARGKKYIPVQDVIEPDLNIFPNRLIMTAIRVCLDGIRDARIKKGFIGILSELEGIKPYQRYEVSQTVYLHEFSIPRADYHRCLSLANAILSGKTFEGFGTDELPSFTLDLDLVFEQYCSLQIDGLMSKVKFGVELQHERPHDVFPRLQNKSIVPDIVVHNRKNHRSIVLDLKNKYSRLRDDGLLDISNPDLYQLSYYLKTLNTNKGVLVYPTTVKVPQYPIRTSESEAKYLIRVEQFRRAEGVKKLIVFASGERIEAYLYQIILTGNMANTLKSVASLCVFIENLLES